MNAALAIIAALLPMVLELLRTWIDNAPKRKQEDLHEEVQQGRQDIANGNVDNVNILIDRVLSVSTETDSASGQYNTSNLLRRTQAVTGADILSDWARSTGATVGES